MRNTANYFSGCHIGIVHTGGELSVTQHYHVTVHLNINPALKEQDLVNQFFQGAVETVSGQKTNYAKQRNITVLSKKGGRNANP